MSTDRFMPTKLGKVTVWTPGTSGVGVVTKPNYSAFGLGLHDLNRREMLGDALEGGRLRALLESGTLRSHVWGRAETTARVLSNIAYMKARDWVSEYDIVSLTGSVYQDKRGTKEFPAAHRFVGNPVLTGRDLPQIPPFSSFALQQKIKQPLAETDILPVLVNTADRRFEMDGACQSITKAIRHILAEQPKAESVKAKMVGRIVENVLAEFSGVYEKAIDEAATNEPVRMILTTSRQLSRTYQPVSGRPDNIERQVVALKQLEKVEQS